MTEDQLVTETSAQEAMAIRADENLRAFSCAWARACAAGDVWDNGDLLAATSGVPLRAYNQAFTLRRPAHPLRAFTEAREYLGRRGVPARLRALEALKIDEKVLAAAGLIRDGGVPCLMLQALDAAGSGADVEVRPVADETTLAQLVELIAATFEFRFEALSRVFTARLLDHPSWHGYVAYVDGHPVATAQLFVNDGVAGIYYVGTLAEFRRRGLGEAMTRRCILDGRAAGCDLTSLQASPEGLPIYERMGFQHVGYYRTYVPKEA